MEMLLEYLRAIHPLSHSLLGYLKERIKVKTLEKKGYLLKAGHTCRHIYFIQEGLVRCFYLKGDNEVSSWFMKEGDMITSIESFFQQVTSYESIQALEKCELYYIDYTELQHIYKTFPEFNFVGRVLIEKYHILWSKQLYGIRMQQASERYKWLLNEHAELTQRVPAKYLASYLGIAESHLSHIKGRK